VSQRNLARYINETLPFLLPFAALPLLSLFQRPATRWKVVGLVFFILSLSGLPYSLALDRSLANEEAPQDRSSAWIASHIPPHSLIGLEAQPDSTNPGLLYMAYWKPYRYKHWDSTGPEYRFSLWQPIISIRLIL
jgi:hypothetical protein